MSSLFQHLLEVHPELSIRPILIGAAAQVHRGIPAGEEMPIVSLERQLAVHDMKRCVQAKSISSPAYRVLLIFEKIYTPCAARYQLSFVLARFRLVAQISIWSSLVGLVERSLEDG